MAEGDPPWFGGSLRNLAWPGRTAATTRALLLCDWMAARFINTSAWLFHPLHQTTLSLFKAGIRPLECSVTGMIVRGHCAKAGCCSASGSRVPLVAAGVALHRFRAWGRAGAPDSPRDKAKSQ